MKTETGYQGWTNYETWAIYLWISNEESSYNHWLENAESCVERCNNGEGNEFADAERRPVIMLADVLKEEHEEGAEQFMANQASPFADLMNHALARVEWNEIAEALIENVKETR